MGIASVLDKAGPALATGIVMAILAGAASTYVAVRSHIDASDVWQSGVERAVSQLRSDLEAFRSPGGRFTTHDGERHWQRMDQLDERIRAQEQRPPRLNPALDDAMKEMREMESRVIVLEQSIRHIVVEQERLCQRLMACKGSATK